MLKQQSVAHSSLVDLVILEEDYGGMGDFAGEHPYGVSFGSPAQLYDTFVKPFTDVVKTAAGRAEELSQRAQTAAKVAFEAIATTLIPQVGSNYNDIFEDEQERLEHIKSKYADVYAATAKAIGNTDVLATAFFFSPAAFLSAAIVKKAPKAALSVISVLGGGNPRIDKFIANVRKLYGKPGPRMTDDKWTKREVPDMNNTFEGNVYLGTVIAEADEKQQRPPLADLLSSDKVRRALGNSPKVAALEREGKAMVEATLHKVIEHATHILRAESVDALESVMKKRVPESSQLKKLEPAERAQVEAAVLKRVKSAMKKFYVDSLTKQVEEATKAGLSQDNPFVHAYAEAIKKISSLSDS